jgi:hypothetical protein
MTKASFSFQPIYGRPLDAVALVESTVRSLCSRRPVKAFCCGGVNLHHEIALISVPVYDDHLLVKRL